MSGLFIVLEGLDGCGKTTQAEKLARYLRSKNHDVLELKEPGGTAIGDSVRSWFLDATQSLKPLTEAFLIESSRHELVESVIRPALADGKTIVCQRYIYSTLAYQGYGRGVDLQILNMLNQSATGGLVPDISVVIDVPVDKAWERLNRVRELDRLEREGLQFLMAVQRGYDMLQDQYPELKRVDGTQEVDAVLNSIIELVEGLEGGPYGF